MNLIRNYREWKPTLLTISHVAALVTGTKEREIAFTLLTSALTTLTNKVVMRNMMALKASDLRSSNLVW